MKLKPVIAGITLILVLGTLGFGVWWWRTRKDEAAKQPDHPRISFVEIATAETTSWQPTARLVGTVIGKRSVTLANEIVGVVTEVGFSSGDTVEAGQVLLRLDAKSELADLAAAEAGQRLATASIDVAQANARSAQSSLDLAKSNQRRFADAATSKSVSASEVDRVNAEVSKATAELERATADVARATADRDQTKARLDQIKTTIAKKTLAAPFRARTGMRTVHPGQYLPEGTSIVGLTELTDDIYLDFAVPQEYAARVVPGMVVEAQSQLLGGDSVQITVESIDSTINPSTRNVRVRSVIKNPGHRLKPGMFIEMVVPTELAKEYVTIPTTAIRRAAFGDHVYVLVPGDPEKDHGAMIAKQRMVTLGPDLGGKVIVSSGVAAGEKVASAGSFKLMEGGLAMQAPPPGAPGAGGPGGPPGGGAPQADEPAKTETPATPAKAEGH
jgi:membrane fusion protein, multidrug efflux system